jgi:site-specific DNA-methyltransferase (adenine-specific)
MASLLRIVKPGGLVLDPFCGSGTTGVAAVQSGFRFLGLEMSREHAANSRERIEEAANSGKESAQSG